MIRRTVIRSRPSGERGIALSKWISRNLSAQLFCCVLISLLVAGLSFAVSSSIGIQILNHTVYGDAFLERIADKQFDHLQEFVTEEDVTLDNLTPLLHTWFRRSVGRKLYLVLYQNDHILFDSSAPISTDGIPNLNAEQFDIALEDPDYGHDLVLSDGTVVQAYLYYYSGNIYYAWSTLFSFGVAFAVFSVCFISFVHRKLSYIKQLKQELEILAGGQLDFPISIHGQDEIGELALGIDQMRRSLIAHQESEDQIRLANSQLVTAMSHDLRTPLTSLLAYLELLDRQKYSSEEQLHLLIHKSLEQTMRIRSMADKLFEYFLVYASEWEHPELEPTDADELFGQFWGEYAFSLESKQFTVHTDFKPLHGTIQANLDLLRRAFDNLYSNLMKYADISVPIEISFHRDHDQVCLTLKNGIPDKVDKKESTNIGLNTCKRILKYHNGTFETQVTPDTFLVIVCLPIH